MDKILIVGNIGTYDYRKVSDECFDKFQKAEKELKDLYPNCSIVSPLKILGLSNVINIFNGEEKDEQFIVSVIKKALITTLTEVDAIYLLTDWRSSAGANMEKDIAEFVGLEIIYQKEK